MRKRRILKAHPDWQVKEFSTEEKGESLVLYGKPPGMPYQFYVEPGGYVSSAEIAKVDAVIARDV